MAKKLSFEELSKTYGVEDVDEIYHEMLEKMFTHISDCTKKKYPTCSYLDAGTMTLAMYNQNYIFLHYLIKLEKQNRKLTEQNQQVIELLTEIKNK